MIFHTPQERKNFKRGFSSRFGRFRHLLWVGWALFFVHKKMHLKNSEGKHMMKREFNMIHSPSLVLHTPKIKNPNELKGCFSRCFKGFAPAFVSTCWIRQAETLEEVGWKRQLETKNAGWFLLSMLLAFTHGIVVLPAGIAYRSSSSSPPASILWSMPKPWELSGKRYIWFYEVNPLLTFIIHWFSSVWAGPDNT